MRTVSSRVYDTNYYLSCCLGAEEFKKSKGRKLHRNTMRVIDMIPFTPNMEVLDLGCGRGDITLCIARYVKKATGIDYSKSAINIAKSLKNAFPKKVKQKTQFVRANVKKLSFKENSFDLIIAFDIFEHLNKTEIKIAVKEIKRVLKPDGILFVQTGTNRILYDFTYKYYIYPVNKALTFIDMVIKRTSYHSFPKDPRTKEEKIQHVNEPTFFFLRNLFNTFNFNGSIQIKIGYLKEKNL